MVNNYRLDKELGYVPDVPLPFFGRLKWWHLGTRFLCGNCKKGFWNRDDYECHYVFTHIGLNSLPDRVANDPLS